MSDEDDLRAVIKSISPRPPIVDHSKVVPAPDTKEQMQKGQLYSAEITVEDDETIDDAVRRFLTEKYNLEPDFEIAYKNENFGESSN